MSSYRPSTKRDNNNRASSGGRKPLNTFSFDESSTDGIDKDLLFSPSNSENNSNINSPAADNPSNKNNKYDDSFIFANQASKPTTENYLSNLISNSGDLEDSILGGLMGGPKKSVRPPTAEPISSINKSTRASQVQHKLEPLEHDSGSSPSPTNREGKSSVGGKTLGNPLSLGNSLPDQNFQFGKARNNTRRLGGDSLTSIPSVSVAQRHNSYDDFEDSTNSVEDAAVKKAIANIPSKIDPIPTKASKPIARSSFESFPSPTPASSADSPSDLKPPTYVKEADDEEANGAGGFIPSFLDPQRQTRRRRDIGGNPRSKVSLSLDAPASKTKLDELDAALGFAGDTKKPVVDPFSAAEKKIPALATVDKEKDKRTASSKPSIFADSDDSDDDDMFKTKLSSRYDRKTPSISAATAARPQTANAVLEAKSLPAKEEEHSNTTTSSIPSPPGVPTTAAHSALNPNPNANLKSGGATKPLGTGKDEKDKEKDKKSALTLQPLPSLSLPSPVAVNPKYSEALTAMEDSLEEDHLDLSGIVRNPHEEELGWENTSQSAKGFLGKSAIGKGPERKKLENSPVSSPRAVSRPNTTVTSNPNHNQSRQEASSPLNISIDSSLLSSSHRLNVNRHNLTSPPAQKRTSDSAPAAKQSTEHSYNNPGGFSANASHSSNSNKDPNHSVSVHPNRSEEAQEVARLKTLLSQTVAEKEEKDRKRSNELDEMRKKLETYATSNSNINSHSLANDQNIIRSDSTDSRNADSKPSVQQDGRSRNASAGVSSSGYGELDAAVRSSLHDHLEHHRIVSQLEMEIIRLKDELNLRDLKHHEELKYYKDRFEGEVRSLTLKNQEELEIVEKRHAESLSALKKLHLEELESVKERHKRNEEFDKIANDIKYTSGSIKLLEEHLTNRYKGIDAVRDGQIEARERLLTEMEEKARERADLAEQEGYKLKGILSHMETVVQSLRSQGAEEKERLKSEHLRLQALQQSLEADRQQLNKRNTEELAHIKQRSKELELDMLALNQEKQMHFENMTNATRKLEMERAEFQTQMNASKRALEAEDARLKEEEQRLQRLKDELASDKHAFEMRKSAAMGSIREAEQMREALQTERASIDKDREQIRRMFLDLQLASEDVNEKQAAVDEQASALAEKETAIRNGFVQMKNAAADLTKRERDVKAMLDLIAGKKEELAAYERRVMDMRLSHSAATREQTTQQQFLSNSLNLPNGSFTSVLESNSLLPPPPAYSGGIYMSHEDSFLSNRGDSSSNNNNNNFQFERSNQLQNKLNSGQSLDGHSLPISYKTINANDDNSHISNMNRSGNNEEGGSWMESFQRNLQMTYNKSALSNLPAEVRSAQRTLKMAKSHLQKKNYSADLLQKENSFLR